MLAICTGLGITPRITGVNIAPMHSVDTLASLSIYISSSFAVKRKTTCSALHTPIHRFQSSRLPRFLLMPAVQIESNPEWPELGLVSIADILCNKSASIRNRMLLLQCLVSNSLFWCSGSWVLTNAQLSELRGVQKLRKMCDRKSKQGELLVDEYIVAANHFVK